MKKLLFLAAFVSLTLSIMLTPVFTYGYSGWKGTESDITFNTMYSSAISDSDVQTGDAIYTEAYRFQMPQRGRITLYVECDGSRNFAYTNYFAYRWYSLDNIDQPVDEWNYYNHAIDPIQFNHSSATGNYYGERSIDLAPGTYYLTFSMRAYRNDSYPYRFMLKYAFANNNESVIKQDLKAVKIKRPKSAKKAATIKWKKLAKDSLRQTKKIHIQYSPDRNFINEVKNKYVSARKSSCKIKKLKSKKKYYVRIRAYSSKGKDVHVSSWSGVKALKTK